MTADEARDEMCAVARTAWLAASQPSGTMLFPDVPGSKPPEQRVPWARVTVRHATGRQSSFGNATARRKFTQTGTLWVQVFAPVGDGLVTAYALAQTVVNAYRTAHGTVWYRNARMQEVGSSGAFEQINVLTDFTYDDVR